MDHARTDTLMMLAEMEVKPEKLAAFFDYTVPNLDVSRAQPGNIAFDMLVDEAEPTRVLFHEEWESPAAQQAYMAWRVAQGDLTTLLSFLAAEPKFRALRKMAG